MPRRTANPDPMTVTVERPDMPGVVFTIEAYRDGGYNVTRDGKPLFSMASQLGAYFGASRFPSNRMQAEAIERATVRIQGALPDLLE